MKVIKKIIAAVMCSVMVLTGIQAQPVKAADLGVPIDEAHFPDANFRACVAENSDKDGNGYLDDNEIFLTWNLYCENSDVYSIEGVQYFRYLKGLWCKGNHITEIDLSGNPDVEGVWCSFNDIAELDFSPCPKLTWVYCFNCNLKKLNVRDNEHLAYLECNANEELTELDLSQNHELENLFCSNCGLTELDLSQNPLLCELACFYNDIETLDVSANPLLKRLDVWHNPRLKDINVSNLSDLQYYNIAWTAAQNVDISNNSHLLEFVCGYNDGITSLDLSHNPDLAYLTVECDTQLKLLDLSHNPKLYYLMAFGLSSIESIDFSKNYRLCKAYNDGTYIHETEKLGYVYSQTVDYGGSSDPFDELRHCVALDDRITPNATFNGTNVPDCRLDTNDGLSDQDTFITRGRAIQTLYKLAGEPAVATGTRFTDVPSDSSYYDAVRWGEANNICFGYPVICDNTFAPEELINREDFALMAHRFAGYMKFGTAFDYGRSDWYKDSMDMDFYAWGPFTWALQWKVVHIEDDAVYCLPHGRISYSEFEAGLENLMDLDSGASYAQRVGGNFGADGDPNATVKQGTGYTGNYHTNHVDIVIPTTDPGTNDNDEAAAQLVSESQNSGDNQNSTETQNPADNQNSTETQKPADNQNSADTQSPADNQNATEVQNPADNKNSNDVKNPVDNKNSDETKNSTQPAPGKKRTTGAQPETDKMTTTSTQTTKKAPTSAKEDVTNNQNTNKPTQESTSQNTVDTTKKTDTKKVKAPSKPSLSSVKNDKSKKLTAKWKKVKDANGYQVEYARNKKFTKSKKSMTIKGNATKSPSFTTKKLKKGKVYYVRVRAYKTDADGNKVYGKWSKVKKVKIKK